MATTVLIYIILSGIIALSLALFQYYKKRKSKPYPVLILLRFITVFSILLLIINPKVEKTNIFNQKPNLVLAVDNSSSMRYLNQSEKLSQFVSELKANKELTDKFQVDVFSFGKELNAIDSFSFNEKQTNIDKVFTGLSQVYKHTVAPVVLLTDGNQTYGADYTFSANKLKQPIYPVILGDTTKYADLKIQQLNVNKYAYLKNKFPVETILVYNGEKAITADFKITSGTATIVKETIHLSKDNNSKVVSHNLPANQVGVFSYQASISVLENEKNTTNNVKNFAIEVIDEKTKVALISDFSHPDIGVLKRSIERNEQREVIILKPDYFENQINDFQLLILYQPNNKFKSVFELINSENLSSFIVTGPKTDWNFLNSVSNNYKHDITTQTENYQGVSNVNYSAFVLPDLDFESFPPLLSTFGDVTFSTPYQTILYKKLGNITTEKPLMVTLDVNNRREAVLLGENIWKWRSQSYLNTKSFQEFDNLIGKLVLYLASKKRRDRLNLDYESFYEGSNQVIIKAQYFNKNYEFDTRETLNISVKNKLTEAVTTFPLILKNNNYQADLSNLPSGDYNFTVKATNENISKSGSFKIINYDIEKQFVNANVTNLQALATNSQGKAFFTDNTDALITDLLSDSRYTTIQKSNKSTVPLIDWIYLLGLILLSLTQEWFIRKYNGLT
ncbi:VWA domain-containing protein [Corallibacter sp.]|uniref:VWA domain-containing protein n=1 Tax=Corallibacter sp. TaxID=2038084 RepID=UPI003AB56FD7